MPNIARYIGIEPKDLVFIAEYCGGGFGCKVPGYPIMAMPALLSKKINRPVMMRITAHEEYAIGTARPSFQGHVKLGFREDGKLLAADLYVVQENGPTSASATSARPATRCRSSTSRRRCACAAMPVLTNTPLRGPQRGPGENQIVPAIEPLIDKAARELDIDRVAIRKINAPGLQRQDRRGPGPGDQRVPEGGAGQGRRRCSTGTRRRQRSGQRTAPR